MEQNDCITGITPIMEGSKEAGYTITFEKGNPITILHGRDGATGATGITPIIGTKKDTDGMYYWTIKLGDAPAEWMTDADGNKIRTTGDKGDKGDTGDKGDKGDKGEDGRPGTSTNGHTPVLSVDTFEGRLYWKVDGEWLLHNHAKVPATGDKGDTGATGPAGSSGPQGDAIFQKDGIDNTHPDYVVFTLADGTTTIKLPRVSEITIGIKGVTDEIFIRPTASNITVDLQLPAAEQYKAILAEIISKGGTDTDIATRATSPWEVEILPGLKPGDATQLKITTPSTGVTKGERAVLKLSLIDNQNKEHQAIFMVSVSDYAWYLRGKSSGVYEITCAEELRMFAGLTKNKSKELAAIGETVPLSFEGETVKIADGVTEIDLESNEWSPIGYSALFQGTFDGNNAKIKNLKINSEYETQGFFNEVKNATIKNVIIESGTVKGQQMIGGIVKSSSNSIIIHCVNHADVEVVHANVGGIVGYMVRGCIIACENYGTIKGGDNVGGIAGFCIGAELLACINEGDVEIQKRLNIKLGVSGGIVGESSGDKKYLAACLSRGGLTGGTDETIKSGIAGTMSVETGQYEHNYFMSNSQDINAVGDKPELGKGSTLDIINQAIPEMNKTIKQWNATHLDTPCNYHYESNTGGNLPKLVAAAPE